MVEQLERPGPIALLQERTGGENDNDRRRDRADDRRELRRPSREVGDARSPFRSSSNSTRMDDTPSSELLVMRSTPSVVLNASSSRRVTSRSMVSGDAPG